MFRNLNQVNFRGFGTILPEKASSRKAPEGCASRVISLQKNASVFRAVTTVWLGCGTGSSVLSVSTDGDTFYDDYLD